MIENWADVVADRIVGTRPLRKGRPVAPDPKHRRYDTLLLLGAADTGKTTLMSALAERLTRRQPVALVDADTGQSHIGPPTTVGWIVHETRSAEVGGGIAFVGDVTPVGHLLQLLAALALCVERARRAADVVLIDTPGLVVGGAACSLWWTAQRLLRPERIVALQRENEMAELLAGLEAGLSAIEKVKAPAKLRRKSLEARQEHRRRLFEEYFRDATDYTLSLKGLALRSPPRMTPEGVVGRIVGLTDGTGQDMAIGVIKDWQQRKAKMTVRAPSLDIRRVRCLTVGNTRIDIPSGWS